jgi:signal transduction histidine kinase
VNKDGKPITVAITMSPMYDRSGEPAGTMAIVRDVTSLKEMESRLVEQERLAAVGELAAMVAHEVRNPLAGIRGGCEILLEGYREGDARNEIGNEVIRQVDRLNRMVQDLLLFARPRPMDPVPTDLHARLDRLLGMIREDPAHKEITLRRQYGSEVPIVRVDARQIEQVFLNLLLNACQAVGGRGEVTVSTGANVATAEVSVLDSGPGVPRERIEQIFKPFFTTRSQGTGLGLAICKKIVEAHDGRIEVHSPPGGGARFTVILPRGD